MLHLCYNLLSFVLQQKKEAKKNSSRPVGLWGRLLGHGWLVFGLLGVI